MSDPIAFMSISKPIDVPQALPPAVRARLLAGQRRVTGAGNERVVWHAWGKPEGTPPVVLLHGGSGSWTHWVKNIVPLLDAGRRVLAADLPGFGDSDPPATGNDADAMAGPLAAGLRALVPGVAVDLVGFSLGGLVSARLLAAQPTLARRLVLVGAPAMGVAGERPVQLKAWRHLPTRAQQLEHHRHNLAVLMLHDARAIDALALELHAANVVRDRLPRRRRSFADWLARTLAGLRCPVHAIYGAQDALYVPHVRQLDAAFAAAAPDFRGLQLIEGAGHWVQFEAPEAFNAALARALAR
ncbi:MAG: alpha/beta fold hydrolase [Proteobacteria bacterium]|nr:alpha/beta fold hydrolase [Pseudomonadota bacterium]